jgi:hypothetical protein
MSREKQSALQRDRPALQNIKVFFFSCIPRQLCPGFRFQNRIGSGFSEVGGSGSESYSKSGYGRAKIIHKSRKNLEILCFEVLDVLFGS